MVNARCLGVFVQNPARPVVGCRESPVPSVPVVVGIDLAGWTVSSSVPIPVDVGVFVDGWKACS